VTEIVNCVRRGTVPFSLRENRDSPRRVVLSGLLGAMVALICCAAAAGQSVWEVTPYRIRLLVAFAPLPELTPQLQADLMTGLVDRTDALVGAAWDLSAAPAPPQLARQMLSAVDSVTLESLPQESLQFDKVMLLVVGRAGYCNRVAARELDLRTRLWSPSVSRPAGQLGKLCDVALDTIFGAFAPLALVSRVEGVEVKLRPKAGGLPPRDRSLRLINIGDAFRPVVRYNDRDGNPRRITPIAWTYLAVKQLGPEEVTCRLFTGLRSPLSGRRRGRVEQLALGVVPPQRPSTLVLKARSEQKQVLPGYDVYSHPPDSIATVLVGRSDRRGSVLVPPAANPLRVLLVKNGSELLARLPLVPGLQPTFTAEIPNDDGRLEAEGFITGLQEELVDLVTRREVLLAQTKSRTKAEKFEEAKRLVEQLQRLPTAAEFSRKLKEQREKIRSGDAATGAKIDALFDDTQKLLQKHLGGDEIEAVWQQLRKAASPGT